MSAGAIRQDLNRYIATFGHLYNVIQLTNHNVPATDDPMQNSLIEDYREPWRVVPHEDFLTGSPLVDALLDFLRGQPRECPLMHGPCVIGRLQQTWEYSGIEITDHDGCGLEAYVCRIRQVVRLPPRGPRRLLSQHGKVITLSRLNIVEVT